ncbi:MAG: hypothetical protein KatS3mg108_0709 [Isosphaeraceae bacterium]|nr:MAG: hypothetical protein KatS3mg108_0709 [Isosphaeraceae bacterium]
MDTGHSPDEKSCCAHGTATRPVEKDPVCGMDVDPDAAAGSHEFDGKTYFFCSRGCLDKFRADPGRYLGDGKGGPSGRPAPRAEPSPSGTTYTCPMHPQIVSDRPGSCPICGMALEPVTATGDDTNPELHDMRRRFWVCLVLSAPLLLLSMGEMVSGQQSIARLFPGRSLAWMQMALASPVVLWGGLPFFVRGWASVVNRSLNMFTLIGHRDRGRLRLQRRRHAAPRHLPRVVPRRTDGSVPVYFEAAAVITTLVLLGQVLELRARSETSSAHQGRSSGSRPRPPGGSSSGGREEDVPLERGRIPATGSASGRARRSRSTASSLEGKSSVDESMVTGEPIPVEKGPGAERRRRDRQRHGQPRHAGRAGRLRRRCSPRSSAMVAEAQRTRAPIQRLADRRLGGISCRPSSRSPR